MWYNFLSSKNGQPLATVDVTGDAKFKSIPNALTNLNEDKNKRIECEAEGFPLPEVSWRFQAIEEEVITTFLSNALALLRKVNFPCKV